MLRHSRRWIILLVVVLLALAAYRFRYDIHLWVSELCGRFVPDIHNCWDRTQW